MLNKLSDLRVVIGLFLTLLGLLVLLAHAFSGAPDPGATGIPVNLLGGVLLLIVGVLLGGSAIMKR